MRVAVTTSAKLSEEGREYAKTFAEQTGYPYVDRGNGSLHKWFNQFDVLYIWTSQGWEALSGDGHRYAYHPGTAMFRYKRYKQGEVEPFLSAVQLQPGDSFLDTTLGFGSDCLMASVVVGVTGKVVGVEKSPVLSFLFHQSQQLADLRLPELTTALKRIQCVEQNAVDFLKRQQDCSFDVVYLDPMFEESIKEATNFHTHKVFAVPDAFSAEWVEEALRVAKRRVVVKAHYTSTVFSDYGFKQQVRKTSKFHFGFKDKEQDPAE